GVVQAPIAGLGAKVDNLSNDYSVMSESVKDLSTRMNKIQSQLTDILTAVKTLNAPPVPPPDAAGPAGSAVTSGGPPRGITQQQLYEQAKADKEAGNFDMAYNEFQDYLRWFPRGEFAPNAQFYMGEILYLKKDYDGAVDAFEKVEAFGENNKSPDALFLKGKSYMSSERRSSAIKAFDEVIKNYPSTEVGRKARDLRRSLAPAPVTTGKKKRN
ncbi:MAG: tetratricopeptide repeat protein, partial [Candidatus Solibacter usitatus]|nr:tetratricopeptide repeat protein [Candidatus Solibacter usitatus]